MQEVPLLHKRSHEMTDFYLLPFTPLLNAPFCQQSFLVSLWSNLFLPGVELGRRTMTKKASIQKGQLQLASLIQTIRGHKVIFDQDLASVYGVPTRRLNEQVKRNADRFPADFMFQLTAEEFKILMSQNATSSYGYGGRRKLPSAFTEHGAIMAANVLKSRRACTPKCGAPACVSTPVRGHVSARRRACTPKCGAPACVSTPVRGHVSARRRAIQMSIVVVRTFVELRRALLADRELTKWLTDLERKVGHHDVEIRVLFKAIKSLIAPPAKRRRKIGFEVQ